MKVLVLYDGFCHLCDGTVRFIHKRDRSEKFGYLPLQSPEAANLLSQHGLLATSNAGNDPQSIVVIENGRIYERSSAALRIALRLGWLWPILYVFVWVPRPVRDGIYDWIARNRYRWFGKREQCSLPPPSR